MKITPSKKLIPEDFASEERELIKRVSQVFNPFMDNMVQSLTNAVTLRDNLKCKVYVLNFEADQTTAKLAWDLNEKPTALLIGQITKDNKAAVTQAYSLAWIFVEGKVEATFIGLQASVKHEITLIGMV